MKNTIFAAVAPLIAGAVGLVSFCEPARAQAGFQQAVDNITLSGQTITYFRLNQADWRLCENACGQNGSCQSFTYVKPGGYKAGDPPMCYLIGKPASQTQHSCCISGLKVGVTVGGPPQAPPPLDLAGGRDGYMIEGNSFNAYGGVGTTPAMCKSYCDRQNGCAGWYFVRQGYGQGPECVVMSSVTQAVPNACCVAATKNVTAPPPPAAGSLTGAWRLTTNCTWTNPAWGATVNLSQGAGGALTATTTNDALNTEWQAPVPAPGTWYSHMTSQVSGTVFNLLLHPQAWITSLEFTGTVSGSRIDGRIHHNKGDNTKDDCSFTMIRQN